MTKDLVNSTEVREMVPLASMTSWLVGGAAEYFSEPVSEESLKGALAWARDHEKPVTILSGGTNVLVSDEGIDGLVISLRKFSGFEAKEEAGRLRISALAGTTKSMLLKTFLKFRLEPALFLAGLPGDVGGGVVMNAGIGEMIRPREFVEITDWVEVIRWSDEKSDFETIRFNRDELQWSYRHCEGWRPGVISRVGLSWPLEPHENILAKVKEANRTRLGKQPLDMPSCGSVFVNPPGHKAGRLIEEAGLKGFKVGGAQISLKHANFIVNTGAAKAADIHAVISEARRRVLERFGVELRTEVVYLGKWPA